MKEKECCATCNKCFELEKLDYSNGGCEHTKMEGYACLALSYEGVVSWMTGADRNIGICECYSERNNGRNAKQRRNADA